VVDIASARPRYISAKVAVKMLGGLVTERDLQRWARQGRIAGAVGIGPKTIRFDRRVIPGLVKELSAQPTSPEPSDERPLTYHDRRAHTTFDGGMPR
jgi:hypothetical protein